MREIIVEMRKIIREELRREIEDWKRHYREKERKWNEELKNIKKSRGIWKKGKNKEE